jgi:hypothetical protein
VRRPLDVTAQRDESLADIADRFAIAMVKSGTDLIPGEQQPVSHIALMLR